MQEKAIDNQKLLIQSLKLTPQPLIATIEDFNVKYFELIEKNFIATKPLFKRDYLTTKEHYIRNIVNDYKQIWSTTNTEIEKIILLLENESTLNIENDIKKYSLINTTSLLKEISQQQKKFLEELANYTRIDKIITNNDNFVESILKTNNYLVSLKVILSNNYTFNFTHIFKNVESVYDLLLKIKNFKKKLTHIIEFEIEPKIDNILRYLILNTPVLDNNKEQISLLLNEFREFIKLFKEKNQTFLNEIFGEKNKNHFLNKIFEEQLNITVKIFNQLTEKLKNYSETDNERNWAKIKTLWHTFKKYNDWYCKFTLEVITNILELINNISLKKNYELNLDENFILNPNENFNINIFIKHLSDNTIEIQFNKTKTKARTNTNTNVILFIGTVTVGFYVITKLNLKLNIKVPYNLAKIHSYSVHYQAPSNNVNPVSHDSTLTDTGHFSGAGNGVGNWASSFNGIMDVLSSIPLDTPINFKKVGTGVVAPSILQKIWNFIKSLFTWNTTWQKNMDQKEKLSELYVHLETELKKIKIVPNLKNSIMYNFQDIEKMQFINSNKTDDFNDANTYDQEDSKNTYIFKSAASSSKNSKDYQKNKWKETDIKLPKSKFINEEKSQIPKFNEKQDIIEELEITNYNDIKIDNLEKLTDVFYEESKKFKILFNFLQEQIQNEIIADEQDNQEKTILKNHLNKKIIPFLKNHKTLLQNHFTMKNENLLFAIQTFLDNLIKDLTKINSNEKTMKTSKLISINEAIGCYHIALANGLQKINPSSYSMIIEPSNNFQKFANNKDNYIAIFKEKIMQIIGFNVEEDIPTFSQLIQTSKNSSNTFKKTNNFLKIKFKNWEIILIILASLCFISIPILYWTLTIKNKKNKNLSKKYEIQKTKNENENLLFKKGEEYENQNPLLANQKSENVQQTI